MSIKSSGQDFQLIKRASSLLSRIDRRRISYLVIAQCVMSLLDLIGVILIGILGSLAVSTVTSAKPGTRIQGFLNLVGLSDLRSQSQVAVLGFAAAIALITKTLLTMWMSRKSIHFLSLKASQISSSIADKMLRLPLDVLRNKNNQEHLFFLTAGTQSISVGIFGSVVMILVDLWLLIVLAAALILVDPFLGAISIVSFTFISVALFAKFHEVAKRLGEENSQESIQCSETIIEALSSFRELVVRNRRSYYSELIRNQRQSLAKSNAEIAFLPSVSKFAIEITIVLATLILTSIQFVMKDASHAIGVMSLFMAASSRLAPATLRIQQNVLTLKTSIGMSAKTLDYYEELQAIPTSEHTCDSNFLNSEIMSSKFEPQIFTKSLSLTYRESKSSALNEIDFKVDAGEFVAIVGPSGAGKSSLVDVILGVQNPTSGTISISGLCPICALSTWPGKVAYVPQDVFLAPATIRENIALGFKPDSFQEEHFWSVLKTAQLYDFVEGLPLKLDTELGSLGINLSGGQKQRLGIARALITGPEILILDEATSSLDATTENALAQALLNLRGDVTQIVIAHRLNTVRNADRVVYMDRGSIITEGNFEHVRRQVPDFDEQATLLGL